MQSESLPGWAQEGKKLIGMWAGALLVLLLVSLIGRPDIPIDETRYIGVAWESWLHGDWLVLHANGQPYHHKPPLLFWLIGAGWSLFGVNDWWPRAISTLSSLACAVLVFRIAERLWPAQREVATRAGWLLLSGVLWLVFSTALMFDVLLTACTLLALLCVLDAASAGGKRPWLVCGLAIGFGVLCKGPFILLIVVPVCFAGPWWGGAGARGKSWWLGVFGALALGGAMALFWVVPAALAGGEEFRNAILWRQIAGRVSGELAHRQPIWFYLAVMPVLAFPLFFVARGWQGAVVKLRNLSDPGVRFILAWIVPAFLLLSLSGGKQIHYVLPLWPALALLAAFAWRDSGKGLLFVPMIIGAIGLALVAYPWWVEGKWFAYLANREWQFAGALLVILALALFGVTRRKPTATAPALAGASMFMLGILMLSVVKAFSPAFDMTPMANRLKQLELEGRAVVHVSAYNDQYHFYGRLSRNLEQVGREEIGNWFAQNPDGMAVIYTKTYAEAKRLPADFIQPYLSGGVALIDRQALAVWRP